MDDLTRAVKLLSELHLKRRRGTSRLTKSKNRDRRATVHLGWADHIRGFGVGQKRTGGNAVEDSPCITFYVRRKFPKNRLPKRLRIPESLYLATIGKKFLTDVIELKGPIIAHSAGNIQPGNDVAHEYGEPGTLGLLVRMSGLQGVLGASCSHVLARSGVAVKVGDVVEHPPLFGQTTNGFGALTKYFTRLNTSDSFTEDFALALVSVPYVTALATNGVIVTAIADSRPGFSAGLPTAIQGIHSADRPGKVINPSWTGSVANVPFVGEVQFENLVPYETPCMAGDSGSVVLQKDTQTALGLHVAGSTGDGVGLFMPLWPIFQKLNLTLVT